MHNTAPLAPPIYASFWKRFYAYGYDSLIVTLIACIVSWQLGSIAYAQSAADIDTLIRTGILPPGPEAQPMDLLRAALADMFHWTDLVLATMVSAIYNIFFIAGDWQATPGKRFCGIRVTNADGSRLTFAQSAYRHAASGLSMLVGGVGYLTIFFTREKLAPHDMLCRTRVVRGKTLPKDS